MRRFGEYTETEWMRVYLEQYAQWRYERGYSDDYLDYVNGYEELKMDGVAPWDR